MKVGSVVFAVLAAGSGYGYFKLQSSGILDFARLILTEAFPTGSEPAHISAKGGKTAYMRKRGFLPEADFQKWIDTIHEQGTLSGGYPRRPHPSSFGEAFHTDDGRCPFLYEVDESGTLCSLFNHIDLITYQIFIGGHLGLKFSVKALMAMITQYMVKLRTPMQEAKRYNDTAIEMCARRARAAACARPPAGGIARAERARRAPRPCARISCAPPAPPADPRRFRPLMEDERIHELVRSFTGMPVIEPPFPAHVSILPPGTLLHDHLDQPNFRGMDDPRVPRWLIKVMGYSGLFEHWRVRDCTFLLYLTKQKGGEFFTFAEGPSAQPVLFESQANDVFLGNTGDFWHGIRMVRARRRARPRAPRAPRDRGTPG